MSPYREPSEYTAFAAMDSDVAAILGVPPAELKVDLSGLAADAGRRRSAGRLVVALAVLPLAVMAALAVVGPLAPTAKAPQAPQAVALTALPGQASIAVVAKALGGPAEPLDAPPPAEWVEPPVTAAPSAPTRIVRASVPRSAQVRSRAPQPAVQRRLAEASAPVTPPPAPRRAAVSSDGRSFEDFAGGRASYPRFATRAYEG